MPEMQSSEKSIFLEAIEIGPAAERAAFLDSACGGHAELRAEVEALLRAGIAAAEFAIILSIEEKVRLPFFS